MRVAGRGQVDQRERGARQCPAPNFCRCRAVETNAAQVSKIGGEVRQRGKLDIADRRVEATGPRGRGYRIPQPDPRSAQGFQPFVISERDQIDFDDRPDQPPELVLRMRIIPICGKRGLAWQAAQNKQTGVGIDQRSEGRLANQKTMPSPYIAVAMTVNGSSSF